MSKASTKAKARQKRLQQRVQRRANRAAEAAAPPRESQPALRPALQWRGQPAASLVEQLDGMAPLRNALRHMATERDEWAGIPMLLDDMELVIEPTYPYAQKLMEAGAKPGSGVSHDADGETLNLDEIKIRNVFWSFNRRAKAVVFEMDGKITYRIVLNSASQLSLQLETLKASDAWGIEQESNAVHTLARLVRHRQMKQYLLTGMFMERSKRSGVFYLFRKLRPTVAITVSGDGLSFDKRRAEPRILCSLCMHTIGYYGGSWAGAMTPTDDVVAHLMLMRGDEHMFWRRANQHPPYRPEAATG